MPRVGFKPMTAVFEQAKTVHDLDRADTVIGFFYNYTLKIFRNLSGKLIEFFNINSSIFSTHIFPSRYPQGL
jgi:hypothetical protein